jgi:tetratricopeptide (TPR) repeat protein
MKAYRTRDVCQILGLSSSRVRAYVRAGFLEPDRGPRGEFRFGFPDLVFLRTARGLLAARIPARRVRRVLAELRRDLPRGRDLAGLRIAAEGNRIVVGDGRTRWLPGSGQTLFDFEIAELAAKVEPLSRAALEETRARPDVSAGEWYELGCELEASAPAQARDAYRRALALDPDQPEAHVNLGRLLHEEGDARAAESHYRAALERRPDDPTAAFNLGVALEDLGRPSEALDAYERSLALDPADADAHFNAANLCERLQRAAAALRHWKSYRKLTKT